MTVKPHPIAGTTGFRDRDEVGAFVTGAFALGGYGVRLGTEVAAGQPLLTVHAETAGELAYALDYAASHGDMIEIEA